MLNETNNIDRFVNDTLSTVQTNHYVNQSLKWLPIALLVFKAGAGKKVELLHRIKLLGLSELFVVSVLEVAGYALQRQRPDPMMDNDSFPSGHTAHAFLGAELLRLRLKDKSPKLALAGYGIAATMAAMRLFNKKHWLSDVVAGAALGILAVKLASKIIKTKPSRFRELIQHIKLVRSGKTMNQTLDTVGIVAG